MQAEVLAFTSVVLDFEKLMLSISECQVYWFDEY